MVSAECSDGSFVFKFGNASVTDSGEPEELNVADGSGGNGSGFGGDVKELVNESLECEDKEQLNVAMISNKNHGMEAVRTSAAPVDDTCDMAAVCTKSRAAFEGRNMLKELENPIVEEIQSNSRGVSSAPDLESSVNSENITTEHGKGEIATPISGGERPNDFDDHRSCAPPEVTDRVGKSKVARMTIAPELDVVRDGEKICSSEETLRMTNIDVGFVPPSITRKPGLNDAYVPNSCASHVTGTENVKLEFDHQSTADAIEDHKLTDDDAYEDDVIEFMPIHVPAHAEPTLDEETSNETSQGSVDTSTAPSSVKVSHTYVGMYKIGS